MLRLAHFVTHPIQYFAPLYRELAAAGSVDLTVLFGSDHGVRPSFDEGFLQRLQFDVPLLEGYQHEFVTNRGSGVPSGHYQNFDCPGLEERLSAGRFDALWVHGWGYKAQWQAIRAARRLGIPYLVRGETTLLTGSSSLLRRIARKVMLGRMLRKAAGCLWVGRNNRAFLEQMGVAEARLFPAHYSINVREFQTATAKADPTSTRQRHGAGEGTFVVATASKAIPRKRLQDVVAAVGKLGPAVRLWVLGDGTERPRLAALADQLAPGRVTWHGFVNQSGIPALFAASHAFVLASEEETWGLAVNEAMACALPVVCADRVGCAADLVVEGRTGFTYPTGEVEALAERLGRLVREPALAARLGREAATLVADSYSTQATARQIEAAVRAVTAGRVAARASSGV